MMIGDTFSTGDWIDVYYLLDNDGHLSKSGKKHLELMQGNHERCKKSED